MSESELEKFNFENSYERLLNWSKVLARTVESCYDQIKEALDPNTKLLQDCPSHKSMALHIYHRGVQEKFNEVEAAVSDVEKAIRKSRA